MATPANAVSANQSPTLELLVAPAKKRYQVAPLLIGAIVVLIGVLISGIAYQQAGHRSLVLAVAKDVPVGQVISADDLVTARISTDGRLRPVLASHESTIVGKPAAVALVAGSIITESEVGPPSTLGSGQAVVGLSLKEGQFPPGLAAGQTVRIIDTDPTQSSTLVDAAVVSSVHADDSSSLGATTIALQVPAGQLNDVAAAASAGNVSLGVLAS